MFFFADWPAYKELQISHEIIGTLKPDQNRKSSKTKDSIFKLLENCFFIDGQHKNYCNT